MILVRFILIGVAIYLLVRSLSVYSKGNAPSSTTDIKNSSKPADKKISKQIGDYVDYEEVEKKE